MYRLLWPLKTSKVSNVDFIRQEIDVSTETSLFWATKALQ
jgi:hypothetical protein